MKTIARIAVIVVLTLTTIITGCKKDDDSFSSSQLITPQNFLAADKYTSLIVEIKYIEGYNPTQESLNNLKQFLSDRLNKPNGITLITGSLPSKGRTSYSLTDIKAIEKTSRQYQTNNKTLTAYIFFADGGYIEDTEDTKVLGIAYESTSAAIFEKTIKNSSGGLAQPSEDVLETAVLRHEFGHLLGLVNYGSRMVSNHQDIAHGHHCTNENCLMHYKTETSDIIGNLIGGNIPELDNNCINDLRLNGGK